MTYYKNQKHNELVEIEYYLVDAVNTLVNLSNYLYAIDPNHPLLEEVSSAMWNVEQIDFMAAYRPDQVAAGESWWEERG